MKKRLIIFVLIFSVIFIPPIFIKSLRYDLINGAGHGPSSCSSKEEAIERGVYVCDLIPVSSLKYNESKNLKIEIKEAWIEKSWVRTSGWYWSTKIEDGYNIEIITSMTDGQFKDIDDKNPSGDYIRLGCLLTGECGGDVEELPSSDTLTCDLLFASNYVYNDPNTKHVELTFFLKKKDVHKN